MEERLNIDVHGKVMGFRYEDETVKQATARLVLAAEMEGNHHGYVRLHLQAVDPSLKEILNGGVLRNECAWDSIPSKEKLSRYERALIFVLRAHDNPRSGASRTRKWANEPYITHPIAVAATLAEIGCDEDVVIAGLLHDTLEDTYVIFEQIEWEFGTRVANLVREVTDVSMPGDGNRATRKLKDRVHLANASAEAQTLKVADLLHNSASIVEYDPKFARVYLLEKRALLVVLDRADPNLLRRAYRVLEEGERKLHNKSQPCQ